MALLLTAGAAQAGINKCMVNGSPVFQSTPCETAAPAAAPKPAAAPVADAGKGGGTDANSRIRNLADAQQENSGAINWNDGGSIARAVTSRRDEARKLTVFEAPVLQRGEHDKLVLRGFVTDGDPAPRLQIYVRSVYSGAARNYATASDVQGKPLELVRIVSETDSCGSYGCTLAEELGLNVDRAYLERAQYSGLEFGISGPGGRQNYTLSGPYVQAILRAVASKPAGAAK